MTFLETLAKGVSSVAISVAALIGAIVVPANRTSGMSMFEKVLVFFGAHFVFGLDRVQRHTVYASEVFGP
jgi:hypothetical protein